MQWSMSSGREKSFAWLGCELECDVGWKRRFNDREQGTPRALQEEHLYHFELLRWNRRVGYDDDVFEEGGEGGGDGGGVGGEVEVAVEERVEEEGGLE
jgi:hypothetical protein